MFVLFILVFISAAIVSAEGEVVSVQRILPSTITIDTPFTVTLSVDVDEGNLPLSVIVEETIPENWDVISASPGYLYFNKSRQKVAWLFWRNAIPVQDTIITYQIIPRNNYAAFSGLANTASNPMEPSEGYIDITTQGDIVSNTVINKEGLIEKEIVETILESGNIDVEFKSEGKNTVVLESITQKEREQISDIKINKQEQEAPKGHTLVKGINFATATKTIYVDNIANKNRLCIKDAEIDSIDEISPNCKGENEYIIPCPGSISQYTCTIEENRYKITGLKHSGVIEFEEPPAPTPAPSGGGGGGGGGSSRPEPEVIVEECVESWICDIWQPEICPETEIQTRVCGDWNKCGTEEFKPNTVKTCTYIASVEQPPVEEAPAEIVPPEEPSKVPIWLVAIVIAIIIIIILMIAIYELRKPKEPISTKLSQNK